MSALFDALVTRNPLLGHGPRTHRTGIVLTGPAAEAEPAAARARTRRRSVPVDAPRVHLGRDHR